MSAASSSHRVTTTLGGGGVGVGRQAAEADANADGPESEIQREGDEGSEFTGAREERLETAKGGRGR